MIPKNIVKYMFWVPNSTLHIYINGDIMYHNSVIITPSNQTYIYIAEYTEKSDYHSIHGKTCKLSKLGYKCLVEYTTKCWRIIVLNN